MIFKELWNKIDVYFSKNEIDRIRFLEGQLEVFKKDSATNNKTMNGLIDEIKAKTEVIDKLNEQIQPQTFRKSTKKYRMRPDWYDYLHKSLNNFSQDPIYISKYQEVILGFNMKNSYNDVDKLVYDLVKKIYTFVNDGDNYDSDMERFGVSEYWLTPQEAFELYVEEGGEGDCDDMSALMYGFIISALLLYDFAKDIDRLYRYDLKKPVGHAINIWLNNKNQWKRIESTYYPTDFTSKWYDNSDVFKSIYTFNMNGHLFNEETEYRI